MREELDGIEEFLKPFIEKCNNEYFRKGDLTIMLVGNALTCSCKGRFVSAFFRHKRKSEKFYKILLSVSKHQTDSYVVDSLLHADIHAWGLQAEPLEISDEMI